MVHCRLAAGRRGGAQQLAVGKDSVRVPAQALVGHRLEPSSLADQSWRDGAPVGPEENFLKNIGELLSCCMCPGWEVHNDPTLNVPSHLAPPRVAKAVTTTAHLGAET